jgi:predicted HTH transcriptional regulator
MPTEAELVRLLVQPNESLTLEYKSWLDLSVNHGRAVLAKAAIALANEGGGIIIIGMRAAENEPLASLPRPQGLNRYDQDAINAAINRYADPEIHCELAFATHPDTAVDHAFVVVPGGAIVPVMSTRDQQGEISPDAVNHASPNGSHP